MRRIKKITKKVFFRRKKVDLNENTPEKKYRIITAEGMRRKVENILNKE